LSEYLALKQSRTFRLLLILPVVCLAAWLSISCGSKPTPTPEPPAAPTAVSEQQAPTPQAEPNSSEIQPTPEAAVPITTTSEITGTGEISQTVLLTVIKGDGSTINMAPWEFKRISRVKIRVAGKIVNAPTLSEVLKAAGVTSFNQIIITGANNTLTVPRDQVTDKLLLDYSANDRLKLIITNLPKEQWIKGVYQIKVE
jgi:hypothetical protein